MSRTLLLMRHASAEGWSESGDKGRRLTSEGRQEATAVGAELRELGVQHVLCSSATRTRETVDCLGLEAPVEYMDALYNCGTETMAQRITEVDDEVQVLLVVAHAPAVPSLSAELAWASAPQQADDLQCSFPTAAFTRFELDGSWADLADDESIRLAGVRRIGH
ncbi:SixA phosphatase family protein [Luteococcus peritonei]|uniref:SixA phosphatase family protein n=1 Tax=Luteococcus peritonei TaxID=88874 RepID=A0ABW4RVK9_9ACTN